MALFDCSTSARELYLYCSMMLLPEASSAVRPAKAPSIASLQLITCGDRGAHDLSHEWDIVCHRSCCGLSRAILSAQHLLPVAEEKMQLSKGTTHLGCSSLKPEGIREADWETCEAALVLQYCNS